MTATGFGTELKKLGGRIKMIRKDRKMTLKQLEATTGIAESTLSKYENARYPNVELLTLFMIGKSLGVTVSELTNYDSPIPNAPKK
jgi:transcriptional regulator with XRE-family HTH domain